jgi:hypothetical protein
MLDIVGSQKIKNIIQRPASINGGVVICSSETRNSVLTKNLRDRILDGGMRVLLKMID